MTEAVTVGQLAPQFSGVDANGNRVKLSDFGGKWLVLYFYPKDNTPGCTTEAKDFSEYVQDFQELNAEIIGVSTDSPTSHCKFIQKHNLRINLISDPNHEIAEIYGVWKLKKFMGKEYMGIERSTFLISPEQTIAHIWTKVKVKEHAATVLNYLRMKK